MPLLTKIVLEKHVKKVEKNLCLLEVNEVYRFLAGDNDVHSLAKTYIRNNTYTKYKDKNTGILLEDNIDM